MPNKPSDAADEFDSLVDDRNQAFESIQSTILSIAESSEVTEEAEDGVDFVVENAQLDLKIRDEKKRRREKWDDLLTWLVVAGFTMSYLIIIAIGLGWMNFDNNAFAVPSVVAAGVLETYGLAKLAIRYFFNDDDMHKPRGE